MPAGKSWWFLRMKTNIDVKENVTGDGNKNKFRSNHIQILLIKNGRFIDADL